VIFNQNVLHTETNIIPAYFLLIAHIPLFVTKRDMAVKFKFEAF